MSKFIRDHFDKLFLGVIWATLFAGFMWTFSADLLQLLRDVTVAIFAVVGARKLQDAVNNNTAATNSGDVIMPPPVAEEKKNNLSIT